MWINEHLIGLHMYKITSSVHDDIFLFFFWSNWYIFFLKKFHWTIVILECCVNFCCTAKWLLHICVYICSFIIYIFLFHVLFLYGLSQDIEYGSLCRIVGPCLSILYILVCICLSQIPGLPPPLAATSLSSMYVSLFLFHRYAHLCCVLDSMHNWYHVVFIFLFSIYFTWCDNL